jgi:hypothetical protein
MEESRPLFLGTFLLQMSVKPQVVDLFVSFDLHGA